MVPVSNEYKENVKKNVREITGFVEMIINGGYYRATKNPSQAVIAIRSDDIAPMCNLDTVTDIIPIAYKYASFEQDRFILDGSMILPNNNDDNENTGYISENVGNTGSLEITVPQNSSAYIFYVRIGKTKNMTIFFDEGYATDFTIELDAWYPRAPEGQDVITYTYNITNNSKETYTLYGNDIEDSITVEGIECELMSIRRISVNITGWSEPNRRVRIKQITAGESIILNKDLIEINFTEQTSLNNFEMPGNECNIVVNNYDRKFNLLDENSILNKLDKRTKIRPFVGIKNEYIDLGSYTYSSYTENGNKTITINGIGTMQNLSNAKQVLINSKNSSSINVKSAYTELNVGLQDEDIVYNGTVELNRTNVNIKKEQIQSLAIYSGNYIKESRDIDRLLQNQLEAKKISYQPLDNISLNIQTKEPKIIKYNKTKYIKMSNYQIGTLDNTEKILVDDYHIDTSNAKVNSGANTNLYMNVTNPIDISSIKVYMKNPGGTETQILDFEHHTSPNPWVDIYNSYYVPYIRISYFNVYEDGINIKVVGKEYSQSETETTIENTNLLSGETVEYNDNYIQGDYDRKRVARYLFNNEMEYSFEIEFNGDPSLEVGDTITFETVDGNMLGIIEKIDLKYNGGLIETISGVCRNVLQ